MTIKKNICQNINLEDCMSVKSVKYLLKYVYKDMTVLAYSVHVYQESKRSQTDYDEILMHLDARYIYIYAYCIAMYIC